MPWYFPFPESIKKRACRYLLQHYMGQFLKEKLTLDQLSVDLYNGTGTVQDVLLDVWALNETLESFNAPLQIVDGFIGKISIAIPWSALINDSTTVEIHDLEITLQPREPSDNTAGVMLESMFSSMTTSMQLAQECLRQEPTESDQQAECASPIEGLEIVAQTLEAVLSRVKVSFIDTIVRMEHLPKEAKTGAAIEIRIKRIDYFDDISKDPGSSVDTDNPGEKKTFEPVAFSHKNFHFMGVTFYCDEFPASHRTQARDSSPDSTIGSPTKLGASPDDYSPLQGPHEAKRMPESGGRSDDLDPIKVAVLMGRQEIKLKIKQVDEVAGPKMELDCIFGALNAYLSPRQVHLLLEIIEGLSSPGICDDSNISHRPSPNKPMQQQDFERVERELQRELQHGRIQQHKAEGQLRLDMWQNKAAGIDESDDDDLYYDLVPNQMEGSNMESSISSSVTSKSSVTSAFFPQGGSISHKGSAFQSTIPPSARAKLRNAKQKENLHKLLDDPSAEVKKIKMKMSYMTVTILHEDPQTIPSDALDQGKSSTEILRGYAEAYFSRLESIRFTGMTNTLSALREELSQACQQDHLGLIMKPLTLESFIKNTNALSTFNLDLSIGNAELVEGFFDRRNPAPVLFGIKSPKPDYCELLVFPEDDIDETGYTPLAMYSSQMAAPKVHLKIQQIEKHHQNLKRPSAVPKKEVTLDFAKCLSEIDITIVDRIQSLLNPTPLASNGNSMYKTAKASSMQMYADVMEDTNETKTSLKLVGSFLELVVRFPIPDLRKTEARRPWWLRSLHEEKLLIQVTDYDFHTTLDSENVKKFEFICKDMHGLLHISPDQAPISFIRVSTDLDNQFTGECEDGFGWPRIAFSIYPAAHSILEDEEEPDEYSRQDSLNGACEFRKPESSPFSSRKVMFEDEQLVMPGDRVEATKFQDKCLSNTRYSLELTLPNVNLLMPSKDFYELLYNRIVNDMLLWEPLAPTPITTSEPPSMLSNAWAGLDLATQYAMQQQDESTIDHFTLCKSGIQYDSSSDSEEESDYSTSDNNSRLRKRLKPEQRCNQQNYLCVTLNIGKGKATLRTRCKDSEDNLIENKCGEILLEVEDGCLFVDAKHNDNPNLSYLSVQAHRAILYHAASIDIESENLTVERATRAIPNYLNPIIYLSESGVVTKLTDQVGRGNDTQDMLSLAIKIKFDPIRNIKEFCLAVGLRCATLQHRFITANDMWLFQVLDFFDVRDFDVMGYIMPKVVTELHAHMWSCAVDYRPLSTDLNLRAMLTMETFSITSNIVANSPVSLLRFILDDGALYLSDQCHCNFVDLKKNYVCVIDVGMFELSLRSSDGKDPKYAKLDLRASNNIVHLRTCSDSCQALTDLLLYIANNGDILEAERRKEAGETLNSHTLYETATSMMENSHRSSTLTSPSNKPCSGESDIQSEDSSDGSDNDDDDDDEVEEEEDEKKLKKEQQMAAMHDLIDDAMLEPSSPVNTCGQESGECSSSVDGKDVFCFPGDQQKKPATRKKNKNKVQKEIEEASGSSPVPSPKMGRKKKQKDEKKEEKKAATDGEESDSYVKKFSSDEEFCIIDDPGLGIAPRDGEPKIRLLTNNPIVIIENHFALPIKSDALRSPEHFPPAVYRYTLREISLIWHMYGGKDFSSSPDSKTSPINNSSKKASPYADRDKLGKAGWRAAGGVERDLDVLMEIQLSKLRFQHEEFPEDAEQASRQIIMINDAEIRDRLASSKINKFLYQFTSEEMPKQAHASMLVIKALHSRPDKKQPQQEECAIRVSLQPLRLNIDQDALFFLRTFFSEICSDEEARPEGSGSSPNPDFTQPVMVVGSGSRESPDGTETRVAFDEISGDPQNAHKQVSGPASAANQPIYFKTFIFSPDVPIRFDYHGKHVDMEQIVSLGPLAGLLVGLAQLNCSEVKLKRINYRHGLLGADRLLDHLINEWLQDIRKNQLPSILGGVGPMHSIVQLVQGVRDLVWLPVEQYQKDGRILRGIQRGTQSFTTSTAMATLELTNRLVQSVQYVAEVAFDMVSPGPSVRQRLHYSRRFRPAQPADLREGVVNAYTVVKEGLTEAATNIAAVAKDEHERKGVAGAVGGVLRQTLPTIIQPVRISTEATSSILEGARNQLRPDKRREDEDKWKTEDR